MSDEDDRIKRGLQHIFSPDWANRLGERAGRALRERTSDGFREAATSAARRYAEFVKPELQTEREASERAAASAARDAEVERLVREARTVQGKPDPTYAGEIEEPRAVTFQREFSNDQEKEAYLERIRQAQKNAGSK